MDFGDPLTSYIIQTCARIAGVLESHFEPYVAKLIPPLLAHIQEELKFDVFVAKYTIILRMMGVSGSDRR